MIRSSLIAVRYKIQVGNRGLICTLIAGQLWVITGFWAVRYFLCENRQCQCQCHPLSKQATTTQDPHQSGPRQITAAPKHLHCYRIRKILLWCRDERFISQKNGTVEIVFSQELCCTRWLVRNRRTRWEDLALAHPWFSSAHQIVAHLTFSSSSLSSSSLICSANCTSHRHTIITSITSVS